MLKGYKAGADDYLNKPFDSEVLLAKLKAILQRKASNNLADSKQYEFQIGNFHLNSKLRFLKYKDEEPNKLSPKENELLRLLALHEKTGRPLHLLSTETSEQIFELQARLTERLPDILAVQPVVYGALEAYVPPTLTRLLGLQEVLVLLHQAGGQQAGQPRGLADQR